MKLVQRIGVQGLVLGFFAMLIAAVTLLPVAALAQSHNITINSQVFGLPPSTPPTIDDPADSSTLDKKSVTASGTCVTNLVVKLYRNNLFAGSAVCDDKGAYTLANDLVEGRNDLVARQYDTANQASPDSDTVIVYYLPKAAPITPREDHPTSQSGTIPSESTDISIAPFQLVIDYQYSLQAIFPGQSFQLPVRYTGGNPPYAVSVDWSDDTSDLFSRNDASSFDANHKYAKPGFYTIKIKVSDKNGQQAYIQFVVIVNGNATEAFIASALSSPEYVWVRSAGAGLLVLTWGASFLAGGTFQLHRLRRPKK